MKIPKGSGSRRKFRNTGTGKRQRVSSIDRPREPPKNGGEDGSERPNGQLESSGIEAEEIGQER